MASSLISTADVEAIVGSGLTDAALEVYINQADAEIVRAAGAHQSASSIDTSIRAGVLVDVVKILIARSGRSMSSAMGVSSHQQSDEALDFVLSRLTNDIASVGYSRARVGPGLPYRRAREL